MAIAGTAGDDVLTGTELAETIEGGDGNDRLSGLGGDDALYGGAGNDWLDGGPGDDALIGGDGNDMLVWDPADNPANLWGGDGIDIMWFTGTPPSFDFRSHDIEKVVTQFRDDSGLPWAVSTVHYIYLNGSPHRIFQLVENDDGTTYTVEYKPGVYTRTMQLDGPTTGLPTSERWTYYDALGRLTARDEYIYYDAEGYPRPYTRDEAVNTDREFVVFDVTNDQPWQSSSQFFRNDLLEATLVRMDDGTHQSTEYDFDNSATWASIFRDDFGLRAVLFDDGTRLTTLRDREDANPWNEIWNAVDGADRIISQTILWDDQSRTVIDLDETDSQPWSQAWFNFDALGRLDSHDVLNDDGSRVFYDDDADGSEPWQYIAYAYDRLGDATHVVILWDNGSSGTLLI